MIKDEIIRLIGKGKSPEIINFKIRELHQKKHIEDNNNILTRYKIVCSHLEELLLDKQEMEEINKQISEYQEEKSSLESENEWLLELGEFGQYKIPNFTMTDEEIEAYKTENFVEFRKARFMSELGKQFEALYDDVKDSDSMPLFQQININVKEEFKK